MSKRRGSVNVGTKKSTCLDGETPIKKSTNTGVKLPSYDPTCSGAKESRCSGTQTQIKNKTDSAAEEMMSKYYIPIQPKLRLPICFLFHC